MPDFRIGIDLGTTNCALAWLSAAASGNDAELRPQILPIPQQVDAASTVTEQLLPSFLVLPPGESRWIAGIRARSLAPEIPGRVISSAKSWFVHHAVDRRAKFLPLGRDDLAAEEKLSPVQAAEVLLRHLRLCWDATHPEAPLARQEVAVTVPASFDPVARQLTLEAAMAAGLPETTCLLEEPLTAFYAAAPPESQAPESGEQSVLVVDIGGGTTDFSLFVRSPDGRFRRVAVGDHILLGGDNFDLAVAHALEARLSRESPLPPTSFQQLLQRSREIKEDFFSRQSGQADDEAASWQVGIALPGASLLKGTLRAHISAAELNELLVEGFFPVVGRRERPMQTPAGLREMGLPYAKDAAITRHLAAFLRGQPHVDAVLFNGGSTKPECLRKRILDLLADWQGGHRPVEWKNPEPDCAVALGAARFLHLRATGRAEDSTVARSMYLGVGKSSAVCILPHGTPVNQAVEAAPRGLRAAVGQRVSFPIFTHTRRPEDAAGAVVLLDETFCPLPGMETVLHPPREGRKPRTPEISVGLQTRLQPSGALEVLLVCRDPSLRWKDPWRLEFAFAEQAEGNSPAISSLPVEAITQAADRVIRAIPVKARERTTGNALLSIAERSLGAERATWTAGTVRNLFDCLIDKPEVRAWPGGSAEALCQIFGYLLRPGAGVPGDEERVKSVVPLLLRAPDGSTPRSLRVQQYVALRRIASGLTPELAARVWEQFSDEWCSPRAPSPELILLAGSLRALPTQERMKISERIMHLLRENPANEPAWRALGQLLSRFVFGAGADAVLPADAVRQAWEGLCDLEVPGSARREAAACWLRAARLTGLREADVSADVRRGVGRLLRTWGIEDVRRRVLEEVVPVAVADVTRLLGEAPPPGLRIG